MTAELNAEQYEKSWCRNIDILSSILYIQEMQVYIPHNIIIVGVLDTILLPLYQQDWNALQWASVLTVETRTHS